MSALNNLTQILQEVQTYLERNSLYKAERLLERELVISPNSPELWQAYSLIKSRLGAHKAAQQAIKKADALNILAQSTQLPAVGLDDFDYIIEEAETYQSVETYQCGEDEPEQVSHQLLASKRSIQSLKNTACASQKHFAKPSVHKPTKNNITTPISPISNLDKLNRHKQKRPTLHLKRKSVDSVNEIKKTLTPEEIEQLGAQTKLLPDKTGDSEISDPPKPEAMNAIEPSSQWETLDKSTGRDTKRVILHLKSKATTKNDEHKNVERCSKSVHSTSETNSSRILSGDIANESSSNINMPDQSSNTHLINDYIEVTSPKVAVHVASQSTITIKTPIHPKKKLEIKLKDAVNDFIDKFPAQTDWAFEEKQQTSLIQQDNEEISFDDAEFSLPECDDLDCNWDDALVQWEEHESHIDFAEEPEIYAFDDITDNFSLWPDYQPVDFTEPAQSLVTSSLSLSEKARLIAIQFIHDHDWPLSHLDFLIVLLSNRGYGAVVKTLEEHISNGMTPSELILASKIHSFWKQSSHFWIRIGKSGYSDDTYKNISWAYCLNLIHIHEGPTGSLPDEVELQESIEYLYDEWINAPHLIRCYRSFYQYFSVWLYDCLKFGHHRIAPERFGFLSVECTDIYSDPGILDTQQNTLHNTLNDLGFAPGPLGFHRSTFRREQIAAGTSIDIEVFKDQLF